MSMMVAMPPLCPRPSNATQPQSLGTPRRMQPCLLCEISLLAVWGSPGGVGGISASQGGISSERHLQGHCDICNCGCLWISSEEQYRAAGWVIRPFVVCVGGVVLFKIFWESINFYNINYKEWGIIGAKNECCHFLDKYQGKDHCLLLLLVL